MTKLLKESSGHDVCKAFAAVSAVLCSDKKISSSAKDTIKDVFKCRKEILANLKDGKYAYI